MTDGKKSYTVNDRRRVDHRGQRRQPLQIPGKREISFKEIREPLDSAFQYFRAQVEHLPGKRWPRSGQHADLLRGFIISTQQLYAATILLMADGRPKQLVMPAGVLARALVEGLGNLLAIVDAPSKAPARFLKDDYLNTYRKVIYNEKRFGHRLVHENEMRKLAQYAKGLIQLSPEEQADPEKHLSEWPTPGRLLKSDLLTGERRQVFDEVYQFWYRSLSALAHHRLSALQSAVYTEEQPNEETFVMVRSVTTTLAVSVALCVLSEVEAFCTLMPHAPLRAAWEKLRDSHDIIQSIYRLRYGHLLKMELLTSTHDGSRKSTEGADDDPDR